MVEIGETPKITAEMCLEIADLIRKTPQTVRRFWSADYHGRKGDKLYPWPAKHACRELELTQDEISDNVNIEDKYDMMAHELNDLPEVADLVGISQMYFHKFNSGDAASLSIAAAFERAGKRMKLEGK